MKLAQIELFMTKIQEVMLFLEIAPIMILKVLYPDIATDRGIPNV